MEKYATHQHALWWARALYSISRLGSLCKQISILAGVGVMGSAGVCGWGLGCQREPVKLAAILMIPILIFPWIFFLFSLRSTFWSNVDWSEWNNSCFCGLHQIWTLQAESEIALTRSLIDWSYYVLPVLLLYGAYESCNTPPEPHVPQRNTLFREYSSVAGHRNWQIETAVLNLAGFLYCTVEIR